MGASGSNSMTQQQSARGPASGQPGGNVSATSLMLARLMGPALLAMALSLVINRRALPELARQVSGDWAVVYLSGILLLVAGIAIVERHNIWSGWPAVITGLGWLAIVGGLVRMLAFPNLADIAAVVMSGNPNLIIVPATVLGSLGAYLTLKGFRLLD